MTHTVKPCAVWLRIRLLRSVIGIYALACLLATLPCLGLWSAPVHAQSGAVLSEADLLAVLQKFKAEIEEMQKQLAASPLNQSVNRRALRYDEYSTLHASWSARLQERYAVLNGYYEQVNRIYRANPNSRLYLDVRKAYVDAKASFDALNSAFAQCAKPEDTRTPTIVVTDGRLNTHLTKTVSTVKTETNPAVDISRADELRYIGKFDAVELYLLTLNGMACYVMYGLHERKVDDTGQVIDEVDSRVVFSQSFKAETVQSFTPQDHLDYVLKLDLTPVQAQIETWRFITESLARAKSYARGD
ncbi:MAG: hypothetical protein SNJ67_11000 [Chloracidobacterium sp.]|uniref:Uncharacterized protein n=1 Tax=Chloracidobacterium validum TaxID=2821543 RepID=A0ABX8BC13_9BACT|nr:hypothetical protein [Chloracidobacterium validum]QUW04477.1 hypothetical protein J8C06_11840 [Chloracidobacterium validum]